MSEDQTPSEYAESAAFIVKKNQDPQDLDEQIYQSNIPKAILPNTMMLGGIVNAFKKLTEGDTVLIDKNRKQVYLYKESVDENGKPVQVLYRKLSLKGYRDNVFWHDYWHGMFGTLMQALPAIEGGVRKDGVTMVSSITNSQLSLMEAQNKHSEGFLTRQYHRIVR